MTLSANPALQNNLTHTFLAEGVTVLDRPRLEASEDLRVHLVPLAGVPALIDAGGFVQALHVAPILRFLHARAPGRSPRWTAPDPVPGPAGR